MFCAVNAKDKKVTIAFRGTDLSIQTDMIQDSDDVLAGTGWV